MKNLPQYAQLHLIAESCFLNIVLRHISSILAFVYMMIAPSVFAGETPRNWTNDTSAESASIFGTRQSGYLDHGRWRRIPFQDTDSRR